MPADQPNPHSSDSSRLLHRAPGLVHVLLVDADPSMMEALTLVMHPARGIMVAWQTPSVEEAVALAEFFKPDVVVMDASGNLDVVIESVKRIAEGPSAAKILTTSLNNQPGYARALLAAGASGYLTKDSPLEEIVLAVHTLIDGKTYVSESVRTRM